MEEKILVRAQAPGSSGLAIGLLITIVGIVIAATCLTWETIFGDWAIFASAILGGIIALWGLVLMFAGREPCEICVTENRVYGRTQFGKRVDLPMGSVSAVSVTPVLSGVSVSTSSGRISFNGLPKYNDVFKELSTLIVARDNLSVASSQSVVRNTADEIKLFKDLLDAGAITQEEYDTKKRQLLEL